MPRITDIVDVPVFLAVVRQRLARGLGERCVFGRSHIDAARPHQPSIESARAAAQRDADRAMASVRDALARPHDPSLLRAVSWQYGFSSAASEAQLVEAARARVELATQNHEHTYSTSAHRLATLAPRDEARAACEAIAEAQLAEGRWLQAQAWRAAAFSLGAERRPDAIDFDGDDPRPARAREQPSTRFRAQPWRQRHWLAWDCKNYGITDVPTLVAEAHDESFSVRARVYRSLGQVGHPAAVFTLRDALEDAHPFARAQAARALGWLGDAGAVEALLGRARRDMDEEVQRASRDALARIVALWEHWGEWPAILSSPSKLAQVAQRFRLIGAFGAVDLPVDDAPSCGRESERVHGHRYDYNHYFEDAQREHEAQANAGNDRAKLGARIDDALDRNDTRALGSLCAAVSALGADECEPRLRALSTHSERAVAFHAARALRASRARRLSAR